jgi:uncharacterized protein
MKRILLVARRNEHPPYRGCQALVQALLALEGCLIKPVESLEQVPIDLMAYDAMVLYFHEDKISDPAMSKFEQFVVKGGGVLAIHSATASFMKSAQYFEILGGRFLEHGPVSSFEIMPVTSSTGIFAGIQPFSVKDELYIHETQPGIKPQFIAIHNKEKIPVIWTHHYGKGRICYAVPGHRTETMRQPDYQFLLQQALKWVSESKTGDLWSC